jgi:hypothetical protein
MLVISTRNKPSERNRFPQKVAPITIDHSTTDDAKRRKKVWERDSGAMGAVSDAGVLTCDSLFTMDSGVAYESES